MAQIFRSLIFVPGNNAKFLENAKTLPADIVCLDLEDSVPGPEKDQARKMVGGAVTKRGFGASVFVRINPSTTSVADEDLREITREGLAGVVVPKVDRPEDLKRIEVLLEGLERERGLARTDIIPSIESPGGVRNCYEIASYSERIPAVVFGIFDLLHNMGIEYTKKGRGAMHARARVALDAAAARVVAIDGIWQDTKDDEGLREDCRRGRSLGYKGKSVIHPSQIDTVHEEFKPNAAEIEWSKRVCGAYLESMKKGRGATTLDGLMIDEVHYKRADALLKAAGEPAEG
ncbi:citrate lyase beta subunit [Cenarchaeum symbiosum A]|uniref:Citrate lyase beta subunit n=1 Tax=Cenarchaeum symbiosum (strain A) TaxID=414004 RepID=A0RYE6_CENSY|nr:citrate lyase beta subunit [Cenarchaeum symbiosum A]